MSQTEAWMLSSLVAVLMTSCSKIESGGIGKLAIRFNGFYLQNANRLFDCLIRCSGA